MVNRRRLILAGSAAGLAGLGGFAALRRWGGTSSPNATASFAVLPFANLSGDPAQAFFSKGLGDEPQIASAQI